VITSFLHSLLKRAFDKLAANIEEIKLLMAQHEAAMRVGADDLAYDLEGKIAQIEGFCSRLEDEIGDLKSRIRGGNWARMTSPPGRARRLFARTHQQRATKPHQRQPLPGKGPCAMLSGVTERLQDMMPGHPENVWSPRS
jgi:hypothetical protein